MANPRHATPVNPARRSRNASVQAARTGELAARSLALLGRLTRIHVVILSLAMCSIVLAFGGPFSSKDSATKSGRISMELPLAAANAPTGGEVPAPASDQPGTENPVEMQPTKTGDPVAGLDAALAALPPPRVESFTIKRGDTISGLFASAGLSAGTLHRLISGSEQGRALATMYPGETIEFVFDHLGELSRISRVKSPLETISFLPDADKFLVDEVVREAEIKRVHRSGIVEHSLSLAAEKAGLSPSITMNMANIFGGVMDFALDVRSGDYFTVIYEEHFLDGKKLQDGAIVAARYVNAGTAFNAFRYEHSNGEIGYYNEDGVSMRKVFLRAPLDFTRVSSSFNLRRLHPITKKVKPHRGIDYAARTGTPVFSVGDGRVITSGYSKSNGKYVVIRHGESYTTKYLHLHKRSVKRGQRVKQGQIIGQVGCTGLCTGPHLHYEFLANGVHRNPRTILKKLPKAKTLAKAELPAFSAATEGAREILAHFSQQFALASLAQAE